MTGEIGECERRDKTGEVQAAITQESTLASANGATVGSCVEGESLVFVIEAVAGAGKPAFAPGSAQVCGLAYSRNRRGRRGRIVDIESWCTYVAFREVPVGTVVHQSVAHSAAPPSHLAEYASRKRGQIYF